MASWNNLKDYYCCVCNKKHNAKTPRTFINQHNKFLETVEGIVLNEIGHEQFICDRQYYKLKELEFKKQRQELGKRKKEWYGEPLQLELLI